MILADTNVLLDVVTDDPVWEDWSQRQLDAAVLRDRLAIVPVVYAELSGAFVRYEEVDAFLDETGIDVIEMPRPALFLASQVFKTYRSRGGPRASVLPDFFVGAQAAVLGAPLITRDIRRYRTYFPNLDLIAPP
jgi:predicted nucleic acid-binding protein